MDGDLVPGTTESNLPYYGESEFHFDHIPFVAIIPGTINGLQAAGYYCDMPWSDLDNSTVAVLGDKLCSAIPFDRFNGKSIFIAV